MENAGIMIKQLYK